MLITPFPDYSRSIVNLMSSIALARGAKESLHPTLDPEVPSSWAQATNLLFLVIDGLGYEYLVSHGRGSRMHEHLSGAISSVAPATTAAAIPTFLTGLSPAQHGFTGWFGWYRELGCVTAVLPYVTRHGGLSLANAGIGPGQLSGATPFPDRLTVACEMVSPRWIAQSIFNRTFSGKARIHDFEDMAGLFKKIRRLVRAGRKRKYIHAYWPKLDSLAHEFGIASHQVAQHFEQLDSQFQRLMATLSGSDTLLIVTADHGFVDIAFDHNIHLHDHPLLADCLTLPLCGEPRLAYAYVHPDRKADFEAYVASELSEQMQLFSREQVLQAGLFGPGKPHPRLAERIGDYVLALKDGWLIKDQLPAERPHQLIGVHGGLSEAELRVPLVVAEL